MKNSLKSLASGRSAFHTTVSRHVLVANHQSFAVWAFVGVAVLALAIVIAMWQPMIDTFAALKTAGPDSGGHPTRTPARDKLGAVGITSA